VAVLSQFFVEDRLVNNPEILEYTTRFGAFKRVLKGNVLTGFIFSVVPNTIKLGLGSYKSEDDYWAETGKDLTIMGGSAILGATAAGFAAGTVAPGVGNLIGAVVGLGVGIALEMKVGDHLQNFYKNTIIPTVGPYVNGAINTITNTGEYIWNGITSLF
jgi:hypothetical protein